MSIYIFWGGGENTKSIYYFLGGGENTKKHKQKRTNERTKQLTNERGCVCA